MDRVISGCPRRLAINRLLRQNLKVRVIIPAKTADCCVIGSEAKVSPMTMPKYFARSPKSILRAMKFTERVH